MCNFKEMYMQSYLYLRCGALEEKLHYEKVMYF